MLSSVIRRTLLRSGTLFSAQRLLPCAISPNRPLTWPVQRGLATTSGDLNTGSTADSEPEPKPKSTSRKARSSKKVAGKDKTSGKKRKEKKKEVKQKIKIKPEHRPPKQPGTIFTMWLTDWIRTQPKADSLPAAQNYVRQGGQIWHTVPEDEKQRYKEKLEGLRTEYKRRMEEWREQIDPAVLREMNRRRAAKSLPRIRGPHQGRPLSSFLRYFQEVRENTPWTQAPGSHQDRFKALAGRVSSQWRAMSEDEKAKYNDPAKADLAAWREKRKAEGHGHAKQ